MCWKIEGTRHPKIIPNCKSLDNVTLSKLKNFQWNNIFLLSIRPWRHSIGQRQRQKKENLYTSILIYWINNITPYFIVYWVYELNFFFSFTSNTLYNNLLKYGYSLFSDLLSPENKQKISSPFPFSLAFFLLFQNNFFIHKMPT